MKKKKKRTKICSRCKRELVLSSFYKSKTQSGGYQAYCRGCNLDQMNERYPGLDVDKRRLNSRRVMLKSKYGLSLEDYDRMLKEQNGVCAICLRKETSRSNSRGPIDNLKVDHCHITGKIRGLLCSECNFGISKFDDKMGLLISATSYLLKFKQELTNEEKNKTNKI